MTTTTQQGDDDADLVNISESGEGRPIEERIKDFGELLKNIESLDDKKRQLWREIYDNAISDRQNAFVMFVKLARIMKDDTTQHAVHAKTAATWVERMSRANEQLIKLADLIAKAEQIDASINPDDMFNQIKGR